MNNTFGERHCYVAAAGPERSEHAAEKSFHVSPFMDVSGQYRFTLRAPEGKLRVTVENWNDGKRSHMANINAIERPANTASLARLALMQPFSSLGVTVGIHWQALKIWIRGAAYRPKPEAPEKAATIATDMSVTASLRSGEPV